MGHFPHLQSEFVTHLQDSSSRSLHPILGTLLLMSANAAISATPPQIIDDPKFDIGSTNVDTGIKRSLGILKSDVNARHDVAFASIGGAYSAVRANASGESHSQLSGSIPDGI